ncbi:MAG TPA: hypothetical protein EYP63_04345 [Desulfotomaculum sp.]|nr:hypothetical protein [Desulfotomaculum sp.]
MKKLGWALVAVALVTGMGFLFAANAPAAETQEVRIYGAGTLTAQGDGIAILGGKGAVDLSGNGILWVKDLAGDATIEVTGHGRKKVFPDGWVQYAGLHGTAHIAGTRIIVVLAGVNVELEAHGRGRAILWGHGTYQIDGQTNEWRTGSGTHLRLAPRSAA